MFFVLVILMSMFVCSFSSILSAIILVFLSISIMMIMYWNILTVIPIYLFSLFMLGGLFVMIGLMMMIGSRDMDSISDYKKSIDLLSIFMMLLLIMYCSVTLAEGSNLSSLENSYFKEDSLESSCQLSCAYLFMISFLLLFLFFMFFLTKSSGGGFVKNWGDWCSFA